MKESTRAYLYRIVTVVIPILTAYGVVSEEKAPLFVALAAAVFSTALAAKNTSTTADEPPAE